MSCILIIMYNIIQDMYVRSQKYYDQWYITWHFCNVEISMWKLLINFLFDKLRGRFCKSSFEILNYLFVTKHYDIFLGDDSMVVILSLICFINCVFYSLYKLHLDFIVFLCLLIKPLFFYNVFAVNIAAFTKYLQMDPPWSCGTRWCGQIYSHAAYLNEWIS